MAERVHKIYLALSGVAALVGTLAVSRSFMSGGKYEGKEEMHGKTVIVTGANKGIGKETAKEMARRGKLSIFHLFMPIYIISESFIISTLTNSNNLFH